jgi:transcription antitermination factor NusG
MGSISLQSAEALIRNVAHSLPNQPLAEMERNWYAVSTLPRNERAVERFLDANQIESFLPTCESIRQWKNRQRVKIVEALFPTYVFAKIHRSEQASVLRSPGVRRIIGNHKGPIPLRSAEVEFLRSGIYRERIEPFKDLVIGQRVRIVSGPLRSLEGTLVRKKGGLRFVLSLELINQNAAIEVAAEELEPIAA